MSPALTRLQGAVRTYLSKANNCFHVKKTSKVHQGDKFPLVAADNTMGTLNNKKHLAHRNEWLREQSQIFFVVLQVEL